MRTTKGRAVLDVKLNGTEVVMTMECPNHYEAMLFYDDVCSALQNGKMVLDIRSSRSRAR